MTDDTYSQPSREWWAQRWIDVLESFGWIRRLARARIYAREGNVLSIEFKGAKVHARVQGTAPEPYKVILSLDPFSEAQWSYVIETMAEQAVFTAKLLAGEMPQNIEEVFTANGLSLFPFTKFDIHSGCSCPDQANPCKHIGAVYYLLGDRFSEDPFVLFQLRGRTKDQIIEALRRIRSAQSPSGDIDLEAGHPPTSPPQPSYPLALVRFWQFSEQLEASLVVIAPPPSDETVLDVLGAIPVAAEGSDNMEPNQSDPEGSRSTAAVDPAIAHLKTIYQQVSQQAVLSAMRSDVS